MSEDTWVKVCGMTRLKDVEAAIAAGADAIGLILVSRSPRCIDEGRATELAALVNGRAKVVVLVEGETDAAVDAARRIGADMVQPYGPGASDIAQAAIAAGMGALVPVAVVPNEPITVAGLPAGAMALLDSSVGGRSGGTGITFDWRRARRVSGAVIAGGLDAANVAAAIAAGRPWGVDASSRLEADVGIKDHGKVSAFIKAAKTGSR